MNLHNEIKKLVQSKELDKAILLAESELKKKPKTKFHWIINKDFLHLTDKLYGFIDINFTDKELLEEIIAFYSELNAFSLNYDKWFLDIAAYNIKGNFQDDMSDWPRAAFWRSNYPKYFELKGLRKLRIAFKKYDKKEGYKNTELKETAKTTEFLVILKLQQLFETVIQKGRKNNKTWSNKPWGVTAHDYQLIYEIE